MVEKLDEPCELQLSMSSDTSMDSESKQEPVKITEPLSEDTEIQIGAKETEGDSEESKEDGNEGD